MTANNAGRCILRPARASLLSCTEPKPTQLRLHDTAAPTIACAKGDGDGGDSSDESDEQLDIWRPQPAPDPSRSPSPPLFTADELSDVEERLDFWLCPEIRNWILSDLKAEGWKRQRLVLDREAEERRREKENKAKDEDEAMESDETSDDDAPRRQHTRRRICVDSDDEGGSGGDSGDEQLPVEPKPTIMSSPTMHSPELAAQSLLIPELLPKGFLPTIDLQSGDSHTLVEESQIKEEVQESAMDIDTQKAVVDFGLGLDIDMDDRPKPDEFVDVDQSIMDIEAFLERDIDVFMPSDVTTGSAIPSAFSIGLKFSPKLGKSSSGEGRLFSSS